MNPILIAFLIWFTGALLAYVLMGLISLSWNIAALSHFLYFTSWLAILIIFSAFFVKFLIFIYDYIDSKSYPQWLIPSYTFKYLKDKYYANKK